MKVICAGLPKTGTKSLRAALLHLGYSNHDVNEHWYYNMQNYIDALEGRVPDFRRMYEDVDSITDTPACVFYEEIFKAFPDAKVVLAVRDSEEEWRRSLEDTSDKLRVIIQSLGFTLLKTLTPTGRRWVRLSRAMVADGTIWKYTEHNSKVQSVIPRERLLVFNCKQGWEALCKFLGKEVPNIPFPRRNVQGDMVKDFTSMDMVNQMRNELVLIVTVVVLLSALLFSCISAFK